MDETKIDFKTLDRECGVFCRYLIGQTPNDYVRRKYREAHRCPPFSRGNPLTSADKFLVQIARFGPWSTNIIDAYTRVFRPFSTIRKKLVLLLAILESCAPTYVCVDSVDSSSIFLLFLRFVQRCLTFVLLVIVGVVVILPVELMLHGSARWRLFWLPRHG